MTIASRCAAMVLALLAGPALGQAGPERPTPATMGIPVSATPAPASSLPIGEPKRFVTRHKVTVGGAPIAYTAIAGETFLHDANGDPTAAIFAFSYIKDGPPQPRRPVLFVFNGGPGSSSLWLHMGVVGPRRLVLDREVNPSNVPPYGLTDNPHTLLDVADLVFVDPVGTGWSRAIGKGANHDFWGVDADADAMAQFIESWLTEHGRWNAPKFVMGESYGSTRAAVLPRALMGGPLYVGRMRGITLDGIVLLGTTLEARDASGRSTPVLGGALDLPALADTAWYHNRIDRRGRSLEAFHQEVLAFARVGYADALRQEGAGTLSPAARAAIVARLVDFTGLPATAFEKSLAISSGAFSRQLLADRGLQVGIYDSRYTLPLAGSGNDPVADDPAMGRYVPGFVSAFHQMAGDDLKIRMGRPYGAIVWKDLLPAWDWKRAGTPQDQGFAVELAIAMRRNPALRLLVASGYYDLGTHTATAEEAIAAAKLPADRVTLRRYASGHMLYLGDTAGAFAADVRAMIGTASR